MLDERTGKALQTRDERKNVIASVAKQSIIVLFVATFLSACTDYVQQIEDRYGEWDSSIEPSVKSSGSTAKSSSDKVIELVDPADVIVSSMTDSRDGQTYKTVKIGSQTWMAENLNYKTSNSYCYDDDPANCSKYGRLYTWAAAMDSVGSWSKNSKGCGDGSACSPTSTIRGVCPSGWLMPSKSEWETLFTAVGGVSNAGKVLKSSSGWNNGGNGTDAFSFSMLPAGEMDLNGFSTGGYGTRFWSSTEDEDDNHYAYNINLSFSKDNVELNDNRKYLRLSVRCLKD